jgi:carboxypeptidase Taq
MTLNRNWFNCVSLRSFALRSPLFALAFRTYFTHYICISTIITMETGSLYQEYVSRMNRIADIRYSSAVLQWDQETYLPPKGAALRGQQIATLSELSHHYFTEESFGNLLKELMSRTDLGEKEKRNVALTYYDYSRQQKLSSEFVRKLSETVNKSYHNWIKARRANDFGFFQPDLSELVSLKKQEANLLGYDYHPYDALLNEFDKGSSVAQLDEAFNRVKEPLKDLLTEIMAASQPDDSLLKQHFPKQQQWDFGMKVLKDLGFDFEAGRQDISEHPFTTNFNSSDVRVTTRIDENDLGNMVWSCIHELGHALYEQGLPANEYGLPLGEAASLSIHESQSRLWENHVGRSIEFCHHYLPVLKQYFPGQLSNVSIEEFYGAINKVQPSFIRTEADEVTYHFHVMIRYELEKRLIEGSIDTKDIPEYWNQHYKDYLGVEVTNDKQGCLQDVHWSHGSFGYFPTYSLGSFYAAQIFTHVSKQIKSFDAEMRFMNVQPLLNWLRNNIHSAGRMYESDELCKRVTGDGLNISYFLDYVLDKYRKIYNF